VKIPHNPTDPSHRPLTPTEAAWQAAEAIRALNHLTLATTGPKAGYSYPGDVDAVLGALQTLTSRLPQAFVQASSWLAAQHRRARIGHDHLSPPPDPTSDRTLDRARDRRRVRGQAETMGGSSGVRVEDGAWTADAVSALCADLHTAADVAVELSGVLQACRAVSSHLTGTNP
jgi:hypothetical protein